MSQTVGNSKRRVMGSAKVEIAAYGSDTWYDLGYGEGVSWVEGFKTDEAIPDNSASLGIVVLDQFADVDYILWQPDFEALALARGDMDTVTVIAGSLVSGYTQTVASGAWAYSGFIEFAGQNASGLVPTMDGSIPVVGSTDGTLTIDTDYELVKVSGRWGVMIKDSSAVTTLSQTITLKYSYTPVASVDFSTGGASIPGFLKLRLTNTTSAKTMVVNFYKAQNTTGFSLKMAADSGSAKPNGFVMKWHCVCDATRTAKDQLYKISHQV
jgi:hypothetical protein